MKLLSLVKRYTVALVISCSLYSTYTYADDNIFVDMGSQSQGSSDKSKLAEWKSKQRHENPRIDIRAQSKDQSPGSIFSSGSGSDSNPYTRSTGQEGMRYREESPKQETDKETQKTENVAPALFEKATYENFEKREGREVFDESYLAGSNS